MKITKEAIVTSPFDACANVHDDERMSTNEPYATWDDVPDDLKPAAEESDREDAHAYIHYNVGSYYGDNYYTEEQWRCARKLYLQEHTQQDSQQEWVNGRPPVGETCAIYDGNMGRWYEGIIDFISDDWCVFTAPDGQWCQSMAAMKFEPIPAEQKPDEREIFAKEFSQSMSDAGSILNDFEDNFDFGRTLYDWLVSTGRLTQGGGDE